MSQRRVSPPLAPEDDWFDEPEWFPEPGVRSSVGGDAPHEPRASPPPAARSSERPPARRNRRLVVAAAVGALGLLVCGALVARALTGSDGATETTAPTLPETTATTPPTTTTMTTDTTPTTTATTDTTTPPATSLRPGDESAEVRQLQTDLVALGYSTGGIDGKYGPATEEAVRDFQESSGLVVDGIAGAATLAAISQALDG